MAWGGGLTGLGQLMAAGAGLGKSYQDFQEQQARQRREQMMMEEFRQKQAEEKRKQDTMAGLFAAAGRLPMAQTPQAGMSLGATAMAPTDAMPATSPQFSGSAGGGGMVAGGSSAGGALDQVASAISGLGVSPEAARGAASYMDRNESGLRPDAVNPTSGATGIAQWLGPRKAALTQEYGDKPGLPQQISYMGKELQGPENRTLQNLRGAKTEKEGYDIWGRDFERPGQAALAKAGVGFMKEMAQAGGNPQQAQGIANGINTRLPQQFRGSLSGPQLVQAINEAAPDADPATKGMILEHLSRFADKQTQQEWDQYKEGTRQREKGYEFDVRQREVAESRKERRQFHQESLDLRRDQQQKGGTVYQPEGGPPMFIDQRGQARPITDDQGNPLQTPLTKPGGGGGPRNVPAMIMQQYRKENPFATSADMQRFSGRYAADQAIARSFGGGMAGRNLTALNTVADHVLLAREYAEALQNKDIPRANQVLNRFATETGHPEVKDFNAAKTIMADEIVRLLTSTGGTEQDRKGMQELFDAMGSPEQLAGTLNVATRMVSGRLKALEQQYARNDPAKREEFQNDMLTDTAKKVFGEQMPLASEPQGTPANPGGGGKVIRLDENGNVIE